MNENSREHKTQKHRDHTTITIDKQKKNDNHKCFRFSGKMKCRTSRYQSHKLFVAIFAFQIEIFSVACCIQQSI